VWMTMVTEGEHREDWGVYKLAKERKGVPPTWWTVPPAPASTRDPPPPPPLTADVVTTMVHLLGCESFAHKTMREMCAGLTWSLVARDFSLERHFVRLGAIDALLVVCEGGAIVAAARGDAATAAAAAAAARAEMAWEAQSAGRIRYGSDLPGAKRRSAATAAMAAAAAAEQEVASEDVIFAGNPTPPVLRDRAAAVLLALAESDPSNLDMHGGLPALEHAYIVMVNTQHRALELRGAMGLARLTYHPSNVKGAGVHIARPTGSKRTVAAAGGVEALDRMARRAAVGYATSARAVQAARARAGGAEGVEADAAARQAAEEDDEVRSHATALIYALSALLNMSVIPNNQIRIAKRSMWLLLRIRATFSEIVVASSAMGAGVETSAQRIAELSARTLRNVSRNENNRTTLYRAKLKLALMCGFTGSMPLASGIGDEGRAGVDVNPAAGGPTGLPSLGLELLLPTQDGVTGYDEDDGVDLGSGGGGGRISDNGGGNSGDGGDVVDSGDSGVGDGGGAGDGDGDGGGDRSGAGEGGDDARKNDGLAAAASTTAIEIEAAQRPSTGRRSFLKWVNPKP